MHQLDNLSTFLRENMTDRSREATMCKKSVMGEVEPVRFTLILTLAIGGLGIFLFKGFLPRN